MVKTVKRADMSAEQKKKVEKVIKENPGRSAFELRAEVKKLTGIQLAPQAAGRWRADLGVAGDTTVQLRARRARRTRTKPVSVQELIDRKGNKEESQPPTQPAATVDSLASASRSKLINWVLRLQASNEAMEAQEKILQQMMQNAQAEVAFWKDETKRYMDRVSFRK